MSNEELTAVFLILLLLIGLAHLLGYLFVKLRQPKVVGEILAGVVLGPVLLDRLPFIHDALHQDIPDVLDFVYWLGLLLLMFLSGAEMKQIFGRGERRTVGWLIVVGTGIPFLLGLTLGPYLIRPSLAGPNGNPVSLSIILAAGIISATFYTTLVVVAVLTSQSAGAWLDYVRHKGWPLLKADAATEPWTCRARAVPTV
jgi:Kef-type K+ transport system membrane component KefB